MKSSYSDTYTTYGFFQGRNIWIRPENKNAESHFDISFRPMHLVFRQRNTVNISLHNRKKLHYFCSRMLDNNYWEWIFKWIVKFFDDCGKRNLVCVFNSIHYIVCQFGFTNFSDEFCALLIKEKQSSRIEPLLGFVCLHFKYFFTADIAWKRLGIAWLSDN